MNDMNNPKEMYLALYEKYDTVGKTKVSTGRYGLGIFVKAGLLPTPDQKDQFGNTLNGIQIYYDILGTNLTQYKTRSALLEQAVIGEYQWDKIGGRPAYPGSITNGLVNAKYDQHYGLKRVSELIDKDSLSVTDIAELLENFIAGNPELKDEVVEQLITQINEYRSSNNMNIIHR